MLLREGEHTEEAIMSQLTARGNLASDVVRFCNEMSKAFLTPLRQSPINVVRGRES